MNFFPSRSFTIRTTLTVDQVYARLLDVIEPYSWFRLPFTSHKRYHGSVTVSEFHCTRVVTYRQSLAPQIDGTIRSDQGQTAIDVKMMANPFLIVFVFGCAAVVVVALGWLVAQAIQMLSGGSVADASNVSACASLDLLILIGAGIGVGVFASQVTLTETYFRRLLRGS